MKAKILIIAKLHSGERTVTSLELSNRGLTDKDLKNLYTRLNNKVDFSSIKGLKITLTLSKNGNMFYRHSYNASNKAELDKAITDYGMIINYENYRING